MKRRIFQHVIISLFVAFACPGCKSLISPFDQYAYTQTTSLKVDALNMMDLATKDYESQQAEVNKFLTDIQKIYEYDRHRPKATIITAMWQKIIDTSGHLFGGFVQRWKNEGHLNKPFIDDQKTGNVGPAFDQIAELESKLIKQP